MITIKKSDGTILGESLISAEQDDYDNKNDYKTVWLSQSGSGICSVGHASCYAVIIKNRHDTALMHLSSLAPNSEKTIANIISHFKKYYSKDPVEVVLGRSIEGYTLDWTRVKERNESDDMKSPEEYFKSIDEEYLKFFHDEFEIIPKLINLPHYLLQIDKAGTIFTYSDEADVDFEELDSLDEEEGSGYDLDSDVEGDEAASSSTPMNR